MCPARSRHWTPVAIAVTSTSAPPRSRPRAAGRASSPSHRRRSSEARAFQRRVTALARDAHEPGTAFSWAPRQPSSPQSCSGTGRAATGASGHLHEPNVAGGASFHGSVKAVRLSCQALGYTTAPRWVRGWPRAAQSARGGGRALPLRFPA